MPCGDRRGPLSAGPMTGRGVGFCADYQAPWFRTGGKGGRGYRHRFLAAGIPGRAYADNPYSYNSLANTPEQELAFLKNQAKGMEDALSGINTRIAELEKK